jgi:hypothetical protein
MESEESIRRSLAIRESDTALGRPERAGPKGSDTFWKNLGPLAPCGEKGDFPAENRAKQGANAAWPLAPVWPPSQGREKTGEDAAQIGKSRAESA